MAYIEVPFTSGEKKLRPDGVVQVRRGSALWTVLIEVKTGANEPKAAKSDVCGLPITSSANAKTAGMKIAARAADLSASTFCFKRR